MFSLQEVLPSAPPTAVMALISLEDLEGLDDENLDNDISDNPEPMDGDDQLLSHWQAVASTHQVSVPQGEWVWSALPGARSFRHLLMWTSGIHC